MPLNIEQNSHQIQTYAVPPAVQYRAQRKRRAGGGGGGGVVVGIGGDDDE